MTASLTRLERKLGYTFKDQDQMLLALTHRSYAGRNNERLEFLGDGIVNLLIAEALYQRWPKADEGALTRARAELVREGALAVIGRTLNLGERLTLGPGELKSGGHRRDSILADAVEAIVAAIYLDCGFERCRAVVLPWFEPSLAALTVGKAEKDPKTRLQEWLQARQLPLPQYALISESGDEHAKQFHVACILEQPAARAEGQGTSRRLAEQQAAATVIAQLDSNT